MLVRFRQNIKVKHRIWILIIILHLRLEAFAADTCANTGQVVSVRQLDTLIDMTKSLAVKAAETDLKGFCEWNRMDRATGAYIPHRGAGALAMDEYRLHKYSGKRDRAAELFNTDNLEDPWELSLLGHPELKTPQGPFIATHFSNVAPNGTFEDFSRNLIKQLKDKDYSSTNDVPSYKEGVRPSAGTLRVIGGCIYLNPVHTMTCKNAMEDLVDLFKIYKPINGDITYVTGVPLIENCLADKRITSALQRTAVKLWGGISQKNFDRDQTVFSDLVGQLKKDGFPESSAKNISVKILGAIASGGPNFAYRIQLSAVKNFPNSCRAPSSCNLNAIMMAAIAEGMAHADTIKMRQSPPSLYSLPSGARFPCDSGKSYHFWMSAAAMRYLMERGHDKGGAQAAVYASHLGYQITGRGTHEKGKGDRDMLSMPRFGAVENGLRIDMNLAAAGASFGARLDSLNGTEDLRLSEGLVRIMKNGSLKPSRPEASFDGSPGQIYEWVNRTGARAAYDFYP